MTKPEEGLTTHLVLSRAFFGLPVLLALMLGVPPAGSTRCYTDIAASKANSTECGHGTGCIKVYIDSEEFLMRLHQRHGYRPEVGKLPELPAKYRDNPVVLRGCFALQVSTDNCYLARDGYSYCWCDKDLCNGAQRTRSSCQLLMAAATAAAAACYKWFRTLS